MCGRYVSVRSDDDVLVEFDAVYAAEGSAAGAFDADYNIAPTDPVRVIVNRPLRDADGNRDDHPTRQLRVVSWGLVPSWSKDRKGAAGKINARVETVATTNAFRRAYAGRRCLVPADGWYEWRTVDTPDGPRKHPLYMTPDDGHQLAFAGLYEFWSAGGHDSPTLTTCTILTAPAQGELTGVHDRMPVVLARGNWTRWLDPSVDDPADLLVPRDEAAAEHLELRPVSTRVNKVANDGPDLVERVEPEPDPQTLF